MFDLFQLFTTLSLLVECLSQYIAVTTCLKVHMCFSAQRYYQLRAAGTAGEFQQLSAGLRMGGGLLGGSKKEFAPSVILHLVSIRSSLA